jgi:hypothetical protein
VCEIARLIGEAHWNLRRQDPDGTYLQRSMPGHAFARLEEAMPAYRALAYLTLRLITTKKRGAVKAFAQRGVALWAMLCLNFVCKG